MTRLHMAAAGGVWAVSAPAFTPWTASVEAKPLPAQGHWYVVLDEEENGIGEFYGEDHEENVANVRLAAAAPELHGALVAAVGYLRNAKIDLETGAPKATALRTIEGGLKRVEAALLKVGGAQ